MINNIFKHNYIKSNLDYNLSNELFDKIEHVRMKLGYPSLQVSLQINKNSKFSCCTGFADEGKKRKANLKSVYYLGSVSKIYVKGVILKLV